MIQYHFMIKALIFDVGGVLHTHEMKFVYRDITSTFGLTKEKFNYSWRKLIPLLTKGETSEKSFWERFRKLANTTGPLPKESLFLREFAKRYKINQDVIDIVKSLKRQGYKTAILSNTCKPHADYNTKAGIYDEFPLSVLSHKVGMIKPDSRIYKLTLEKLNAKPKEAVFIDDEEENVKAAEKLGLKGIVFKSAKQLKKQLKNLGVAVK